MTIKITSLHFSQIKQIESILKLSAVEEISSDIVYKVLGQEGQMLISRS
jgi:hypothetical protein